MTQEESKTSTRDKILIAAATMITEDAGASLSVRAVAARAGVSTGSLRHFFPAQRELRDTVLAGIYDLVASEAWVDDPSVPARDRLVNHLRQVLAPAGVGEAARRALGKVYEAFIAPDPTDEIRATYLAMEREGRRRVESWLAGLSREGALAPGDNTRRARFLMSVLSGLALERALPVEDAVLQSETETLYMAADCVLNS